MKPRSTVVLVLLLSSFGWSQQKANQPYEDKARAQSESSKSDRSHADSMRSDTFLDHAFMDKDKDGRVSKNEFEQAFAKLDSNSDGFVSAEEWRHASSRFPGARGSDSSSKRDDSRKPDSTKRP